MMILRSHYPSFSFTSAENLSSQPEVVDAQDGEGYDTSLVFAISLSGLTGRCNNGSTHPVTVAGVESPFTYAVQYGGSATAPTNAWNLLSAGSNPIWNRGDWHLYVTEMVIAKATATITLANLNHTYDGHHQSSLIHDKPQRIERQH
jgi:hypothetical protein